MKRVAAPVFAALFAVYVLVPSAGFAAPTLYGNVEPALPTPLPDAVAVVAYGAPVDNRVAILVRNGTVQSVDDIRISATATRPDGGLSVRAKAKSVVPPRLAPGDLGIAKLRFGKSKLPDLPSDTSIKFKVKSDRARSKAAVGALDVQGATLSRPAEGPVVQSLDVTLTNPGKKKVKGPIRVVVMCFGAARNPVLVAKTTVKKARVPGGGTLPVTVGFRELCPSYLVGAYGN